MKKFSLKLFLILIFCNLASAESSLPECKGNDKLISSFSIKHFRLMKKWVNCYGTAMGPGGQKYIGEFYKGKFNGFGIFTHEVGQYKKHKRHGVGTYTYANGDKYEGEWQKAKYYGEGIYTYANGDKYEGEWKRDVYHTPDDNMGRNGKGTLTYANGDKYEGEWKKGLRHGNGSFTYSSGKIEKGTWKKGKLQ